jgi:hypothetical protein
MRETFKQCSSKELGNAVANQPHFADVVEQLFAQTRDQDVLVMSASVLLMLDRADAVALVFKVRKFLPEDFFRVALVTIVPRIMKLHAVVPQLCGYPEVCDALRTKTVVDDYVMEGYVEGLVALARGGPFELIDREVAELFDRSALARIGDDKLWELYGRGRMPTALLFVKDLPPMSCRERVGVAKYLLGLGLLLTSHRAFGKVAIGFLTPRLAFDVISSPKLVAALTDPDYHHRDLVEFREGGVSFVTIGANDVKFAFRVEKMKKRIVVFECGSLVCQVEKDQLSCGKSTLTIKLTEWHSVAILIGLGRSVIRINERIVDGKPAAPIFVGSREFVQGSTFFVDSLPGANDHVVEYRGFLYHFDRIDAPSRIFHQMLSATEPRRLKIWFKVLSNLCALGMKVSAWAGLLR